MSRKLIIIGNWKMNKTNAQTKEFVLAFNTLLDTNKDKIQADYAIAAPFTSIASLGSIPRAAQNINQNDNGAYTSEISAEMLKELEVKYAIIGHSERRQFYGETNETVNERTLKAISEGLIPVVCVGETLQQNEEGKTKEVTQWQIKTALVNVEDPAKLVIAYEPIWAIGTGKTATADQAQDAIKDIRNALVSMYGEEKAQEVQIQYGGSVKPENVAELMGKEDIDGALVGGASLEADSFMKLLTLNE